MNLQDFIKNDILLFLDTQRERQFNKRKQLAADETSFLLNKNTDSESSQNALSNKEPLQKEIIHEKEIVHENDHTLAPPVRKPLQDLHLEQSLFPSNFTSNNDYDDDPFLQNSSPSPQQQNSYQHINQPNNFQSNTFPQQFSQNNPIQQIVAQPIYVSAPSPLQKEINTKQMQEEIEKRIERSLLNQFQEQLSNQQKQYALREEQLQKELEMYRDEKQQYQEEISSLKNNISEMQTTTKELISKEQQLTKESSLNQITKNKKQEYQDHDKNKNGSYLSKLLELEKKIQQLYTQISNQDFSSAIEIYERIKSTAKSTPFHNHQEQKILNHLQFAGKALQHLQEKEKTIHKNALFSEKNKSSHKNNLSQMPPITPISQSMNSFLNHSINPDYLNTYVLGLEALEKKNKLQALKIFIALAKLYPKNKAIQHKLKEATEL
jgi:hypothetical protein